MDKVIHKLTRETLKFQHTDKSKTFSSKIVLGSIIGVFLAITPFIFYSYEYIPDEETWETFLFTYHSGYYESARVGMWVTMTKLLPLILLFVWFFTCRHWWYHALLVPISMFTYQLFATINDDIMLFDNFQLLYLVPIMGFIIPSIYLLRAKMFNKVNDAGKSFEELEEEFMIKPTTVWGKISQYF